MKSGPITVIEFDNEKTIKDYFKVFLRDDNFKAIIGRYARAIMARNIRSAAKYLESDLWCYLSNATMDFDDSELDDIFAGLLLLIKDGCRDHVVTLDENEMIGTEDRVLIPKLCACIKARLAKQFGEVVDPRYINISV